MKPRFRRLAHAGAATVGAAVTALVLAGGSTANADQLELLPGVPAVAGVPNQASAPAGEETPEGNPVVPGASRGPEVPETTPPEEAENQPVVPTGQPQVPETTPPGEETSTQPVVPTASPTPSGTPSEGVGTQPAVPASPTPSEGVATGPAVPETAESQPQLPVTGRDDGPMIAALGGLTLAAGAGLVLATRRRRVR